MGKLYQNKWAGYETYFTPCFPVRTRKSESDAIGGYEITNVDGKWICRKGQYYLHTMRDEEHFPVVGEVKINVLGYVMDTMLNALERRKGGREMSKTTTWVKISDVIDMIMTERDALDYKHGYTKEMYKQLVDKIIKAATEREIDVTEVTEDETWSE